MTPEEQAAVDAYLSNGGKVTKVPTGQSAERMWWDGKSNLIRVESIYKRNIYGKGCLRNIAAARKELSERQKQVKECHDKGMTNTVIAQELQMSVDDVRKTLNRMGLKSHRGGTIPRDIGPEIARMLGLGMSKKEIARALYVAEATVQYHQRKHHAHS